MQSEAPAKPNADAQPDRHQLSDVVMSNEPFHRLYLPGRLDRAYSRWMIDRLPAWRRFNRASGWFVDKVWARAWRAHGYKLAR